MVPSEKMYDLLTINKKKKKLNLGGLFHRLLFVRTEYLSLKNDFVIFF